MGSAVWAVQAGVPYGWTLTDLLLTDLFHALTGEPHPDRPNLSERTKQFDANEQVRLLLEQRERIRRQQAAETPPPPSE